MNILDIIIIIMLFPHTPAVLPAPYHQLWLARSSHMREYLLPTFENDNLDTESQVPSNAYSQSYPSSANVPHLAQIPSLHLVSRVTTRRDAACASTTLAVSRRSRPTPERDLLAVREDLRHIARLHYFSRQPCHNLTDKWLSTHQGT